MHIFKLISLLIFCGAIVRCTAKKKGLSKAEEEECQIKTIYMLESIFVNLVECLRNSLQQGIPQIGIPSIDPLELPLLPLPLLNEDLSGLLILTNFKLRGLTGFQLTSGNITLFPVGLRFGLKFPEIEVSTNYIGRVDLFKMIDLSGRGSMSFKFNDFGIESGLEVQISPLPISITNLSLAIPLPATQTTITGLFRDEYMSDLISRQLSQTLKAIFEQEQNNLNELIRNFIWDLIQNSINPLLEGLTLTDIIAIIVEIVGGGSGGGGSQNCEPTYIRLATKVKEVLIDNYDRYISFFDLESFNVEGYDDFRNVL